MNNFNLKRFDADDDADAVNGRSFSVENSVTRWLEKNRPTKGVIKQKNVILGKFGKFFWSFPILNKILWYQAKNYNIDQNSMKFHNIR
jgi:hypothetical protein